MDSGTSVKPMSSLPLASKYSTVFPKNDWGQTAGSCLAQLQRGLAWGVKGSIHSGDEQSTNLPPQGPGFSTGSVDSIQAVQRR